MRRRGWPEKTCGKTGMMVEIINRAFLGYSLLGNLGLTSHGRCRPSVDVA